MTTTGTYAEHTQAILDDLAAGLRPFEVAQKHGVSKQWVHQIRTRAGLALPPPVPKVPKPPKPKAVRQPKPVPARTLAVLEDVRAGLLYAEIAARHGLTEFYVGCLARQHGIGRSQTDPDWWRRSRVGVRHPDTNAIVRDLQAGDSYAEVAARYGRSLKNVYNMAYRYRIRRIRITEDVGGS